MKDISIGLELDQAERAIPYEVADETLEAAAGTVWARVKNFTLLYCTAVYTCPT
jgi:hypothetical protein